jgi:hypothetical protein
VPRVAIAIGEHLGDTHSTLQKNITWEGHIYSEEQRSNTLWNLPSHEFMINKSVSTWKSGLQIMLLFHRYKQHVKCHTILECNLEKDVDPVPFLNRTPRHEGVLGEWRYRSTHSLTSALDGSEWSVSRPGRFTPRKRASGTHWIGRRVGPRAYSHMFKESVNNFRIHDCKQALGVSAFSCRNKWAPLDVRVH